MGIPLFLLWVSQMGTLLAGLYKVLYYNICCGLCRRGKRRKALALAAKNKRLEEKEKAAIENGVADMESIDLEEDEDRFELTESFPSGGIIAKFNHDSGIHSQQSSLNKSVKIEILQPDVKEILSTCAQYNLDQQQHRNSSRKNNGGVDCIDNRSAEVLEEIRHAEALSSSRAKDSVILADT